MCTAVEPQAFFEELKKRKNSDLNGQKSDKSEQKGQEGPVLKPFSEQKRDMFDRKCQKSFCENVLPTAAGSILLKKCESESELEHQKYEKMVLQLGCLMQTGTDGYEIYKNVGVMHAVVFADRAQEAKSAQVMGRLQNFNGLKKRKNSDRNGQKSDKSK